MFRVSGLGFIEPGDVVVECPPRGDELIHRGRREGRLCIEERWRKTHVTAATEGGTANVKTGPDLPLKEGSGFRV